MNSENKCKFVSVSQVQPSTSTYNHKNSASNLNLSKRMNSEIKLKSADQKIKSA